MSEAGSNTGQGQGSYQNGVWLSKAEGARNEKYQKWTEERTKCKMQSLDRQQHDSLVRLHCEQLQIRTELRGLQQDRRQLSRGRLGSGEGAESSHRPASVCVSTRPQSSTRRLHKTSSSGTLPSATSTGYASLGSSSSSSSPSLSSSSSAFRRTGSGKEGVWGSKGGGMRRKGVAEAKTLDPDVSATKLRLFYSSRALSKLKNNMDINQ